MTHSTGVDQNPERHIEECAPPKNPSTEYENALPLVADWGFDDSCVTCVNPWRLVRDW